MKTRILIFVPDLTKVGGVSNYYRALNLNNRSDISYFEGDFFPSKDTNNVSKHILKKIIKIFPEISKSKTVILNPSFQKNALIRDGAILFLAHLMRKKTVVFFRGWNENVEKRIQNNFILRSAFRLIYGRTDNFITLGEIFEKKLSFLLKKSEQELSFFRETTIVNDYELEYRKKEFTNELDFLFIGRITKDKTLRNILFFDQIQNLLPNMKLTFHVAGSGNFLEELKLHILTEKINNIELHGTVKGEIKRDLFKKCNFLLFLSSHGEGMPNSVLEAMFCGMPIICSRSGALNELIKDFENGLKVDLGEDNLLNAIHFIKNSTLLEQISLNNHTTASNLYTLDVVRNRFLKLINKINNG